MYKALTLTYVPVQIYIYYYYYLQATLFVAFTYFSRKENKFEINLSLFLMCYSK